MAERAAVFTVPSGAAFGDALADGVLRRHGADPLSLPGITILLPTRRACRALTEAFLRRNEGGALLLPRLVPIGETDEDGAFPGADEEPGGAAVLELPPAVPALTRHMILTRLILDPRYAPGGMPPSPGQASRLAGSLAELLDQVQTEGLDFAGLRNLAPDAYADHWRIILEFLRLLTEAWPDVLAAIGGIDAADRRNRLTEARAAAWARTPPAGPVIAAGSTGSIPATADLLGVVARLPDGAVVLPGFDTEVTEEAADILPATHPQYGMVRLLRRIGVGLHEVQPWDSAVRPASAPDRVALARAAMAPPDVPAPALFDPAAALDGVRLITCPGPQEEAGAIALALRRTLETPGRTAALVTPDRSLARRVAGELRRWGIEIDDSAGRPLADTAPGTLLRLAAACMVDRAAPVPLLALLKHPMAAGGMTPAAFRARVRTLELLALRGPRPAPGLAGLRALIEATAADPDLAQETRAQAAGLLPWLDRLAEIVGPFLGLAETDGRLSVAALLDAHVGCAEALAATDGTAGGELLWAGEAGEAAAGFVAELGDAAATGAFPPIATDDYPALFDSLLAGRVVRPRYGRHPRLNIWGLLEARLQHADLLCLGGLNEGTWPADPGADPWMSRPMRADFGLPAPERRIGLAAHDFAQAFAAGSVLLTRAARVEGTPTVPARWLLRLENALKAAGGEAAAALLTRQDDGDDWLGWQAALDAPAAIRPADRPAPTPPLDARPRRLSVTQIETWMRDPYAVYARHILRLRPLDPIDADPGAAERGTMIHDALDGFVRAFPDRLPPDIAGALRTHGEVAFGDALTRPGVRAFWWPRFLAIARWFADEERNWRARLSRTATEVEGALAFAAPGGEFLLTAKADRVDLLADGTLGIVDYKTGQPPTKREVAAGLAPQLPLEAAIAMEGGFAGIDAAPVGVLEFWRLSGGDPAGERRPAGDDPAALAAAARDGLAALIARFDDPATPYLSCPDPARAPRFSDYEHLARVQEWSATGDGGDG